MLDYYPFIKIMLIVIAVMVAIILMTVLGETVRTFWNHKKINQNFTEPLFGMMEEKLRTAQTEAKQNAASSEISVHARVVAKRTNVWGKHAHTVYFATFENDARERTELRIGGTDYGMLAEGDEGTLVCKGSQFVRFERR